MDSTSNSRSLGFVALSTGMHLFLAASLAAITLQMPPTERTEIEILEAKPLLAEIESQQSQLPAAKIATPSPANKEIKTSEVTAKATKASISKHTPIPKTQAANPAPAIIASADEVAEEIEKSLENTPAPAPATTLNEAHLDSALVEKASHVETTDLQSDVESLDVDDSELTAAAVQDLEQQTQNDLKQKEKLTAALVAAQKSESETAAKEDAKIRATERKALADKIAAEELAREQAIAAKALAESQASAKLTQQQGTSEQASGTAPVAIGVRALEDLKQIPGNKRPDYDNEDRLLKRQGMVSFAAYVSREGRLVNFKMIKSSGHRELDRKTLQALKEWQFYPGQEGWVEIPFSWDLIGGPKEMPTKLRRSGGL